MTNEELMIAVHVTVDDVEREIASVCDWFSRLGQDATSAGGRVENAFYAGALSPFAGALSSIAARMSTLPQAQLTIDNTQALSAIDAAMGAVSAFLKMLGVAGLSSGEAQQTQTVRRSSGGGSSSRASKQEQALREAQQAQEEAYRSEVNRIEHRRRLGEITAQEEIALLAQVKRQYAQTAEQIMDIDEAIYDARASLREAEQDKITELGDAVTDALAARYEAQRDAEQSRISESIAAWETWSDATCAAIQRQIDALDEQAQAEDREAEKAENLRKIDSLSQALLYETDAYNRSQLEKQIAQAQEAWAQLQKDWAHEDMRDALLAQMEAVQSEAQQEIDKLEEESARIDDVYDALMDGASLAAQAQKTILQSSQSELLELLAAYAPEYEATGRTLGEKLYDGFAQAFGDVTAWFDQLDARFESMLSASQQAALAGNQQAVANGQGSAVVSTPQVNQTVNFYQPVESASDVARRMQQVSEQLADMI